MRLLAHATARRPAIWAQVTALTAVAGLATALIIVVAFGAPVRAHDLERTSVTLTIEADGRFDLVVENDPNWLLLRLERFDVTTDGPVGAGPPTSPTPPADSTGIAQLNATAGSLSSAARNARLTALAPVFIDRVVLFVDGHEIRPDGATYVAPDTEEAADGRPARAAYRLSGSLPADARALRWYYGLVIDPYPIIIHRADGHDISELVLGDAWSTPLDLGGQFEIPSRWQVARPYLARGFVEFLPRGIASVLFVLALVVGRTGRLPTARLAAFAVAFSVGFSVDALGLTRLPLRSMDLLVALSIVYVGLENLIAWRAGVAPIALAGLVHGARLAHSAIDASPPRYHATTALLSLNLGLAAAELTVVLIGLACLASFRGYGWYRSRVVVPISLALACAGMYWLVRVAA